MKKILFVSILAYLSLSLYSQDIIVTAKGDTINCRIKSTDSEKIVFVFKNRGVYRETFIPISNVSDFKQNSSVKDTKQASIIKPADISKFSYSFTYGYSYMTNNQGEKASSQSKDYFKDLRSGYNWGIDAAYNFPQYFSIGLKWRVFNTSSKIDGVRLPLNEYNYIMAGQNENISVKYFGPTFSTRFSDVQTKHTLLLSASLGYMHFRDDLYLVNLTKATGSTFGTVLEMGYSRKIYNKNSVDFKLSYTAGSVSKFKVFANDRETKVDDGNNIKLNRIDFTIGLTFGI